MIYRNRIGNAFSLTSFGESHGPAMGGVIDGLPAGLPVDIDDIQRQLDRRRPGQNDLTTARHESDKVEIMSGIINGISTGAPIGFIIRNSDQHPEDYDEIAQAYRPSHADYTYDIKYRGYHDRRGGGRASARETVCRVVAGAIARQALRLPGIDIVAYTSQVHDIKLDLPYDKLDLTHIDDNAVRCPHQETAARMEHAILEAKDRGDTVGGAITCIARNVPAGLGEPVYGRLNASLAAAVMSINAAKGVEFGLGFGFVDKKGSEVLDHFTLKNGKTGTTTNYSGGIQGGISNGEDIVLRIAFKPVATLMRDIATISRDGSPATLHPRGRHDACVVPRAVPVVEAMVAITLLDHYLQQRQQLAFNGLV